MEHRLNVFLGIFFVWLLATCAVSVAFWYKWRDDAFRFWPLALTKDDVSSSGTWDWIDKDLWQFLVFMLLYNYVIPISLYVTLELQKMAGAFLIDWDLHLYDEEIDEPAQAKTSGEELAKWSN